MTIRNILFVCSGNSARSIMAEAYMGHAGRGIFRAHSAGARPIGEVHPLALETLRDAGIRPRSLSSKSWDVFGLSVSPHMDRVVTLCDVAATLPCPDWPGHPEIEHWSVLDPTLVDGSLMQQKAAFLDVFAQIRQHVDALLAAEPTLGILMENAARGEVLMVDG